MKGSINDQSTYKLGGQKINVHQNWLLEGKTKGDYSQSGLEIDKSGLREYNYRI